MYDPNLFRNNPAVCLLNRDYKYNRPCGHTKKGCEVYLNRDIGPVTKSINMGCFPEV